MCWCVYSQDREDDIPARRQTVAAINRGGSRLVKQDGMSAEDQDNIRKDLDNLNQRWAKVGSPGFVVKMCVFLAFFLKNN